MRKIRGFSDAEQIIFETVRFLKALFERCKKRVSGRINLRFLPRGANRFIPLPKVAQLPKILKEFSGENAHFAVATRKEGDGTKAGIIEVPALWADLDFKDHSRIFFDKKLKKLRPRPSAIIESGGGLHPYWFLKRPARKDQIPLVESYLKRLALHLGGDQGATDASHLLRIPGTQNFKYTQAQVKILGFKPYRRYSLADFDFLPELPQKDGPPSESDWAGHIIQFGVDEGERNNSVASLAGRYARLGLAEEEAYVVIQEANSRFRPPLSKGEIKKTIKSIFSTHGRNSSQGPGEKSKFQITTLAEILKSALPEYLIDPILLKGTVNMLCGDPEAKKSVLALSIIKAALTEKYLWGKFKVNANGRVLLIDEENPQSILNERCRQMSLTENLPLSSLLHQHVRIDNDFSFQELLQMIKKEGPILVVFDSLVRIHDQRENDATAMARVMGRLKQIANLGVTVLVLHHLNKSGGSKKNKVRGSTDIVGGPDVVFALTNHNTYHVLEPLKNRYKDFDPIKLRFFFDKKRIWVNYVGSAPKTKTHQAEILGILDKMPKAGVEEIFEELKTRGVNLGKNALRKLLTGIATEGKIKEEIGQSGKKIYSK